MAETVQHIMVGECSGGSVLLRTRAVCALGATDCLRKRQTATVETSQPSGAKE